MRYLNIMRIEPGYYKIREKGKYFAPENHYLRVFIKNKVKYLQIDHGIPTEAEKCEHDIVVDYEIVKQLTVGSPIEVRKLIISINWIDEDNDTFNFEVRNIHAFNNVLKLFPRLAKALGMRSREIGERAKGS